MTVGKVTIILGKVHYMSTTVIFHKVYFKPNLSQEKYEHQVIIKVFIYWKHIIYKHAWIHIRFTENIGSPLGFPNIYVYLKIPHKFEMQREN